MNKAFTSISLSGSDNASAARLGTVALETLNGDDGIGLVVNQETKEISVRFVVNTGRGTGAQIVPLDGFAGFIDALDEYSDPARLAKVGAAADAVSVMRDTIGYKNEVTPAGEPVLLTFRTNGEKGQKPATLGIEELPAVCAALREYIPALEASAAAYRKAQKKG